MSEPALRTLGRYELGEEIGRGMMGVVYKARDPDLNRAVALKTVRLAFEVPEEGRELFEKRFLAEARAAAGLSHPGIVTVHDVGRDPATGTLYIALEFLDGQTLAAVKRGGGVMPWREALRIAARVAEALHHAHSHGIVHRDIKPTNIMLLPTGEPKIMDFGIAKLPASQLTTVGEFFGTPSYMSPEQASGEALDGRSDLFSLGCVLYGLLTATRAFDGPTLPAILARVVQHEPLPPSRLVEGLPPEVDYVVMRSLAKDLGRRYGDGRTFAEDIQDVLAGRPPRHRSPDAAPGERTAVSQRPPSGRESVDHPQGTSSAPPAPTPAVRASAVAPFLLNPSARRALLIGGGTALLLGALGVFLFVPRGDQAALISLSTLLPAEPGHLEVTFEHSLKSGNLKVWVDDEQVLDEPLESRVTKKVLSLRIRKGSLRQVLDVTPGEHTVRVQLEGDVNSSRRLRGTFEPGQTKRLLVSVEGILKRDLSLDWGS
ncbi:MAG TPA: serine/threonine-protein kinase [Vicinamibacteria bacterium]|jgi:serine/threonine protein kinase|nr:serine/threonine-protein kinase [Vicinamibacteria bacterium]